MSILTNSVRLISTQPQEEPASRPFLWNMYQLTLMVDGFDTSIKREGYPMKGHPTISTQTSDKNFFS